MRAQANGKSVQGSRSAFFTPTTGLAEIIEGLIEHLVSSGATLHLHSPVSTIRHLTPETWNVELKSGESLHADSVILATPAFVSGSLLTSLDPELAADLQSIPYASTATVSLAYEQKDVSRELDGYGYVIPRREGRRALACTWTSTKFPHRAPEGYALIRVFVGRAGQDIPWSENDLLALAQEELKLTLGITAKPILQRVFLWDKAMPQYNLGHPEILKGIDAALEKHPWLALAGNGYRGIGIPDCIHSGELAVEKVLRGVQSLCEAPPRGPTMESQRQESLDSKKEK
jgi:oxygen-dependent protoporphyrinogen oxidase